MSVNVQGSTVYIIDVPATDWADCTAATTAILAGKKATCIQGFGDLSRTREIVEYSCQDSNSSDKAAGKMSYGDLEVKLLLDSKDTAGQKALYDALENNTPVIYAIESPNKVATSGKSGDLIYTKCLVSGDKVGYPENGKITYDVTLSPYGGYLRCPAT